jgi:serine-type D-Ala-D-Ala carboxypeptidase (penicillin-binding protein 5/6)
LRHLRDLYIFASIMDRGAMPDMARVETSGSAVYRSQNHSQHHHRWGWWLALCVPLLILLGGAGYAAAPLRHPLPAPTATQVVPASYVIPGTAPTLPWPTTGQAAVDIEGLGTMGSFGGNAAVPIASVAKIMTSYVVLTDHPIGATEAGASVKITAAQANAYQDQASRGESLVRITAGALFTERQALQAVLLASANNMARVLAEWDAGTATDFVAKMNATAAALGMTSTHYTDPAGYDPGTVSTAADQVILAHKAMALPAFANIVAQSSATTPIAGTITNFNEILNKDGVVGIKTGSTDQAGGCLVFAAKLTVAGKQMLIVGAVLGQPGASTGPQLDAVFAVTRPLIRAAGAALASRVVVHAGQVIATVHGPLGTATTLGAASDVSVIGWPGMTVTVAATIPRVPTLLPAGAEHGTVAVTATGAAPVTTTLRATTRLAPPSTWERIRHHT